jgi:hypothetical protein
MKDIEISTDLVREFESACIKLATWELKEPYDLYETKRSNLLSDPNLQPLLPAWVIRCRYGSQFWSFIKNYSSTYQGRREFLWDEMSSVLDGLESGAHEPISVSLKEIQTAVNSEDTKRIWKKVHSRKKSDPEGAITASRTLLETVMKHLLDERDVTYTNKDDLLNLNKKVLKEISIEPTSTSSGFRQFSQGISAVVNGIASVRNEFGDAHGKGKNKKNLSAAHVDFVVNMSGSLSAFLLSYLKRLKNKP